MIKWLEHTLESLLCGCGITTSAVEVVAGTDGYDTATNLESSGHIVGCGGCCGVVCDEVWVSRVRWLGRGRCWKRVRYLSESSGGWEEELWVFLPCLPLPIACAHHKTNGQWRRPYRQNAERASGVWTGSTERDGRWSNHVHRWMQICKRFARRRSTLTLT